VLTGARQHGLPEDYVAALERTPARDDPDRERHAREAALRAAATGVS
jgi:gamma-glutamylcyclotransferase